MGIKGGKPVGVAQAVPETPEEQQRFDEAEKRRQERIALKQSKPANALISGNGQAYAETSELVMMSHANGLQVTFGVLFIWRLV